MKLSKAQMKTMDFLKKQVDEARKSNSNDKRILDAQNGIVLSPGGNVTIRTLRKLEELGLIEILEDNSGIGTGVGAFPSVVKLLNY